MSQWQGGPPQDPYGQNPQGPYGQEPYGAGQPGYAPTPGFGTPEYAPPYGQPQPGPFGPPPGAPPGTPPGNQQAFQPGFPPQQPGFQQPYQPPGYPQQRKSNTGVYIFGGLAAVAVLILVIGGVILLNHGSSGKKSPKGPVALPSSSGGASSASPSPSYSGGGGLPSSSPPNNGGGTTLATVLGPTFKTAWNDTYTRLDTRNGTCDSVANTALKKLLASHKCVAPVSSALYRNSDSTANITVTIMKFATSVDASQVATAADASNAFPTLMTTVRHDIPMWINDKAQGVYVVYAHAFKPDGGPDGPKDGPIYTAAVHMGTEVRNTLIWIN